MLRQGGDVYKGLEGVIVKWYEMEDCASLQQAREARATRVIKVQGDRGSIERMITAMKVSFIPCNGTYIMLTMRQCSIEFSKITSGDGCPVSTYLRFHSLTPYKSMGMPRRMQDIW